jgi:hypothetical protein
MKVCHKCLREIPFETRVLRSEVCPWCSSSLHCCLNCRFHDHGAHNECLEHGTELVRHRDEANYCGLFQFRDGSPSGDDSEQVAAKKKLDGLFNF